MGNSKWVSNDVDRRERAQRTDNGSDQTPLDSRMFTVRFHEHILGSQLIGSASHIQGELSLAPPVISRVSACSMSSAPVLGDSSLCLAACLRWAGQGTKPGFTRITSSGLSAPAPPHTACSRHESAFPLLQLFLQPSFFSSLLPLPSSPGLGTYTSDSSASDHEKDGFLRKKGSGQQGARCI